MACFLAPAVEAIAVTIVKKNVKKRETARKLGWLTNLLWGGVFLLVIEHIWHGEVVPWPPFLTAMNNPEDIAPMLHEIATVGVTMAVLVTVIWGIMVFVEGRIYKRTSASMHSTQKVSTLCLIYLGALLMWLVDAFFA